VTTLSLERGSRHVPPSCTTLTPLTVAPTVLPSFPRASAPRRAFMQVLIVGSAFGAIACAPPGASIAREGSFSGALGMASETKNVTRRATREEILTWGTGTYIDRILADRDSVLDRWPNRIADPIRVWVESPRILGDSTFDGAVRDAFSEWVDTGIPLRFRFVDKAADAEVRVTWVTSLPNKTGSTTWRSSRDGWLRFSEITLATHMTSGRSLDTRGVRAIALHEIGHMIGLSHSTDGHDIMAPLVRVGDLSSTDRATARLLYTFPAGRIR